MALDLKRLGQNIRFRRTGRGWSLGELARRSDLSKAYLSDLENGEGGRPNVQYLLQVANCLETTIDGLVQEAPTEDGLTQSLAREGEERPEVLPPGLGELAAQAGLSKAEVQMLAQLHFRGARPNDENAWRTILEVIKAFSSTSPKRAEE